MVISTCYHQNDIKAEADSKDDVFVGWITGSVVLKAVYILCDQLLSTF